MLMSKNTIVFENLDEVENVAMMLEDQAVSHPYNIESEVADEMVTILDAMDTHWYELNSEDWI